TCSARSIGMLQARKSAWTARSGSATSRTGTSFTRSATGTATAVMVERRAIPGLTEGPGGRETTHSIRITSMAARAGTGRMATGTIRLEAAGTAATELRMVMAATADPAATAARVPTSQAPRAAAAATAVQ